MAPHLISVKVASNKLSPELIQNSLDSEKQKSETKLMVAQQNTVALITNFTSSNSAALAEKIALTENLAQVEHIALDLNVGNDISFKSAVEMLVNALTIPYMDAIQELVNVLDDYGMYKILMRPDTTLQNLCEIATVEYRAKLSAISAFSNKYVGCLDLSDEFNQWDTAQIQCFFSIFGAFIVSLDVRRVNCQLFILQFVARYCTNFEELKCNIKGHKVVHQLRPLFSRLRKLHISDCTIGLSGPALFTLNASIEYLTLENCTDYTLPLSFQMPRLVELQELPVGRQQIKMYRCKTGEGERRVGLKMSRISNWTKSRQSGVRKEWTKSGQIYYFG